MTKLYNYNEVVDISAHGFCINKQPHNWVSTGEMKEVKSITDKNGLEIPDHRLEYVKVPQNSYRCSVCGKTR